MRLSRRSRVGSARARKRRSIAKGLFFFGMAELIIYGLTDMSKWRRLDIYAQAHMGGAWQEEDMTTETVKALKAHIAIHVQDVTKSIAFYRKLFGIEPCKVRTGYAKFDVANPPLNFTLNEGAMDEHGGLSHLGIQVVSTDDLLAVRQH